MEFKVRDRSVNRGIRALTEERRVYLQLVDQGVGYAEAARIVGINVRTGKRWRNGRTASGGTVAALPIDPSGASPKPSGTPLDGPSRYLGEADRIHIADRLREKATVRAIAAELGRSPSTVSREIRRNRTVLPGGRWYYRPHATQRRADQRNLAPSPARSARTPSCGTSSSTI